MINVNIQHISENMLIQKSFILINYQIISWFSKFCEGVEKNNFHRMLQKQLLL